jgi:hypothetical protein
VFFGPNFTPPPRIQGQQCQRATIREELHVDRDAERLSVLWDAMRSAKAPPPYEGWIVRGATLGGGFGGYRTIVLEVEKP